MYLALVVLASIVLWYQYFVPASIGPILLVKFHMSFRFFMFTIVLSLFGGVITAAIGQISDRRGRAWVVIGGVGLVAVLQLFAVPNVNSKLAYTIAIVAIGLVEGIMVVVTAALVRDFTPQLGRASAMGFWTLGPVAGLLMGTELVSHTLGAISGDWQREFIISGVVGLVIFVVALLFLRELAPSIRDQLMVTERDRVLVELKAKKLDVESATANPWGQMLRFDIVISAIAVNVMLLLWYTATGVFAQALHDRRFGWHAGLPSIVDLARGPRNLRLLHDRVGHRGRLRLPGDGVLDLDGELHRDRRGA
ncbi:MAG: MFS transporter [Acidimicrobiales bacterium]